MSDARDNLDLLIDSALSTYAEPRTGLEARVLTHVSATLSACPARRRRLGWAIALPISACLVLLLTLYPRHDRIEPIRQAKHNPVPQTQAPPQSPIAKTEQASTHSPRSRIVPAHAPHFAPAPTPLPKLDVFPTPQPLSPREQALIRYVARASEPDRNALSAEQNQPIAPLSIAEIQIPHLEPLDKTGN